MVHLGAVGVGIAADEAAEDRAPATAPGLAPGLHRASGAVVGLAMPFEPKASTRWS